MFRNLKSSCAFIGFGIVGILPAPAVAEDVAARMVPTEVAAQACSRLSAENMESCCTAPNWPQVLSGGDIRQCGAAGFDMTQPRRTVRRPAVVPVVEVPPGTPPVAATPAAPPSPSRPVVGAAPAGSTPPSGAAPGGTPPSGAAPSAGRPAEGPGPVASAPGNREVDEERPANPGNDKAVGNATENPNGGTNTDFDPAPGTHGQSDGSGKSGGGSGSNGTGNGNAGGYGNGNAGGNGNGNAGGNGNGKGGGNGRK